MARLPNNGNTGGHDEEGGPMNKTWQKIVVLVLGFALTVSFAAGAIFGGGSPAKDPAPYLAAYDQQATAYWLSGKSSSSVLDAANRPVRQAWLDGDRRLLSATVTSRATDVRDEDDRLVVEAEVTTTLRWRDREAEPVDSGTADPHRLVFDEATGELLEDSFEQVP